MENDHIADDRKKVRLIDANDVYALFDVNGFARLHVGDIDTIPRVDAVEVCRCKDCKHGCEDHEDAYLCNNAYYGLIGFTRGEDFCSYGERRTEDG